MPSYKIPQPRIVYEVLNTEVIAIDFDTGTYYTLLYVAKEIWLLIEQRTSLDQIAELISSHYGQEKSEAMADVQQFIDQLLKAKLIELAEETSEIPTKNPVQLNSQGWKYESPKLMTYLDVQDLLLLDPIHEATEIGWPDASPMLK